MCSRDARRYSSLRRLSLAVIRRTTVVAHPHDTPQRIAQLVATATPADQLHGCYVQALETVVADCRHADRRAWWQRSEAQPADGWSPKAEVSR